MAQQKTKWHFQVFRFKYLKTPRAVLFLPKVTMKNQNQVQTVQPLKLIIAQMQIFCVV